MPSRSGSVRSHESLSQSSSDDASALEAESDAYTSTLMFAKIAKHMAWKRMTGDVRKVLIFEEPLSTTAAMPIAV